MNASTCTQKSSSTFNKVGRFLLPVLALLVVSVSLFAQGSTGTIRGAIFDSSGGAIAGARVTVTDVDRGISRTLTTDESGQYVAPTMTAGNYSVRAEAMGFQIVERSNVQLGVASTVRVDLTLAPGEQTQTITVTEEIPAIDPTSATLGGTVSNQAIIALPLNGRNFLQLLQLRPGVVDLPGGDNSSSSTNGRRQGADVILIEGVTAFDLATSNTLINGANRSGAPGATLPIDAIQEFNTQQNAPAEYGWRDGSIVNVGVKSGTNAVRGTAYAFGRHAAATDARDYFTGIKSNIVRQQFGATVGGPFIRDKLFWFAGAEFIRQSSQGTTFIQVPSSISFGGLGDPAKSMVDACNAVKTAGGTINPLSAHIAGLDAASCAVNPSNSVFRYTPTTEIQVLSNTTSNAPQNNGFSKIDWNVTDRHHLSGFFILAKAAGLSTGAVQPYWGTASEGTVYQYSGSWTWTVNSNWLNDFRFGTANGTGAELSGDRNKIVSDAPPAGYGFNTGVTQYGGFPCLNLTAFDGLGNCGKFGVRGPQGQLNFRDSVSYLTGNHAFRFGGEVVFTKFDNASIANVQGTFSFDTLPDFLRGTLLSGGNQNLTGGDTTYKLRERWYAAFVGDTWRITPRLTLTPGLRYEYMEPPHEVNNRLGAFDPNVVGGVLIVGPGEARTKLFNAQKANFLPRVGAAWDIMGDGRTVLRSAVGLFGSFPSITSFAGVAQAVPFGSRLCSAGTADACTPGSANLVLNPELTHPGIGQTSPFTVAFPDPNNQLKWIDTSTAIFPSLAGSGVPPCAALSQCQTGATDPNLRYPKSLQWNVDLQRAITNNLTLDVAYVGNHGYDETLSRDLNAVPVGTGWTPAKMTACANRPLTGTNSATSNSTAFRADCSPDATVVRNARPYNSAFPYFNYIIGPSYGGWSNYNGLQVTVDGRNYHGISFLASYTFSHALDTWSRSSQAAPIPVDASNYGYQYGNGDRDIRQRARFSPSWQIPGIRTPGQMLEGWSLSGILSLQGGFAWGPTDRTRNDWAGNGANANANPTPNNGVWQTWNYSGPTSAFNYSGPTSAAGQNQMPCYGRLSGCTPLTVASAGAAIVSVCEGAAQRPYQGNATLQALALRSLYNNACYIKNGGILTPPAYGTLGNSGRNPFRGPAYYNVDLTASKNWNVGERYSAQLRVEVFNLFNTPSFALPSVDPTLGFNGRFGYTNSTAGDPRRMQFGLKLGF